MTQQEWLNTLPKLKKHEFLIYIHKEKNLQIICLKELSWWDATIIENNCIKQNYEYSEEIYSTTKEIRDTLNQAISWVGEYIIDENGILKQDLIINYNKDILSTINIKTVDYIWKNYQKETKVTIQESAELIKTAEAYFRGETEDTPINPLILEVALVLQVGGWTRKEMRDIRKSEMEKIQCILAARSNVIVVSKSEHSDDADFSMKRKTKFNYNNGPTPETHPGMFPPGFGKR